MGFNMPGTPASRKAASRPQPVTPLPDMADAAVRQRKADMLKSILSRRGRSSTMLSGRLGDHTQTPINRPILSRSGG